jgi:uncharacterized repeat protein (TIGR02543 family)
MKTKSAKWWMMGLLAAVAMLVGMPPKAQAATATVNGKKWSYVVSNGASTVTGVSPKSGALAIPSKLGGYPVANIAKGAFWAADGLTSVEIPDSVGCIEGQAFRGCAGLTNVTILGNVTNDWEWMPGLYASRIPFLDCPNIETVALGGKMQKIGNYMFYECAKLKTVTIPDSVTRIGAYAFSRCSGMTNVSIGSNVRVIWDNAFDSCTNLTSVHIHDLPAWCEIAYEEECGNPLRYARHLFLNGTEVAGDFVVPEGTKQIGAMAFYCCTNLTSVTIPPSITHIGDLAFGNCSGLKAVYIHDLAAWCGISFAANRDDVFDTRVGGANPLYHAKHLFLNGREIKDLAIPDGVTGIGDDAFFNCTGLRSVTIPDSVKHIGAGAFFATGLKSIQVGRGNTAYASESGVLFSKNKTELVCCPAGKTGTYRIPGSVTSIGDEAFFNCKGLTGVTIPDGVTNIGSFAFFNCQGLTSVTIPNGVTGVGYGAFWNCNGLRRLYVPDESCWNWFDADIPPKCVVEGYYTVKFDAKGGRVSPASRALLYEETIGSMPTPERAGYKFLGWYTAAGGGSKMAPTSKITASRTVYAHWQGIPYAIRFDANGGSGAMAPQTVHYGTATKLRKNAFTRPGCVFAGWAENKSGKVEYGDRATVKNLRKDGKNTTLYAKWARRTYKVSFNANGGKGRMPAQAVMYGTTAKLRKNAFKRNGWVFLGWATAKNGKVAYKDAAGVKNLRADGKTATLYAVWEKGQTVKFDTNGGKCATDKRDFRIGRVYGGFPVPEWNWHTFLGWFTAAGGGEWVSPMDIAETAGTRRLFARWSYLPLRLGVESQSTGPLAASRLSVAVSAKADWTAASDAGWLAVRTKSGRAGKGTLLYDVAANRGEEARTGRIVVSARGAATVFTVTQQAPRLELSASKKVFSRKAAKGRKLGVRANVAWKAKSSAKWLVLKTASGKGNGTIVYEIAQNKKAGRAADITVTGGGKSVSFRVAQKGRDGSDPNAPRPTPVHYLQIEPDRQTCGAEGETNGFAVVSSDVSWKAETSNGWIKLKTASGTKSGLLQYQVARNTGKARTGKIRVTGGKLKETLVVGQLGKNAKPYLLLSPTNRTAAAAASKNEAVLVEANVAWTVWSSAGWIVLKTESGKGNGKIAYAMAANTGTASRTGFITVSGGGMAAQLALTQAGKAETPAKKWLRVAPGNRMHRNAAGSGTFLVEANVGWIASADKNWICVNTPSGGNNGSVSYSVAKNTGGERRGTITVSGGGMTATFAVGQGGRIVRPVPAPPRYIFEVLPHRMHPDWQARELECVVNSSVPWKVHSHNPHIQMITAGGGPAAHAVRFRVDENPSTHERRAGHVTAESEDATLFLYDSCMVVQSPKPKYLEIRPHSITGIPWKGASSRQCKVYTASQSTKWRVQSVTEKWIHVTGQGFDAGTAGDGYLTFSVDANRDAEAEERTGKIIVTDGESTSTCVITQKKGVTLEVTPRNPKHLFDDENDHTLAVKASVDWTSTLVSQEGGEKWIRVLTKGGKKGKYGTIKYELVRKNETDAPRKAKIKVTGGGKTVFVTITQAASKLPNLRFYKPKRWPAAAFVTGWSGSSDANRTVRQAQFTARSRPIPYIRYAWKNTGTRKVESYAVKEVLTGPRNATWTKTYNGLAANSHKINQFCYGLLGNGSVVTSAPASSGKYVMVITLDPDNKVAEINENDNVAKVAFMVRPSSSQSTKGVSKKSGTRAAEPDATGDSSWVAVTASGNTDAGAVIDSDENTGWTPETAKGSWVVLTFSEPRDVEEVEVVGDNLPEGTRFLLSEDADHWTEDVPGRAQYVWVVFPAGDAPPIVKEIRVRGAAQCAAQ